MYIKRTLEHKLLSVKKHFPIVGLVGPRQSGKTTLLKHIFKSARYVNLEDIQAREFALKDPVGFLNTYTAPLIIDEIQRVPDLLSQLQVRVDRDQKQGRYIISGSQNILLSEKISQSLAGRVSLQTLLPLSYFEITNSNKTIPLLERFMYRGQYPRLYKDVSLASHDFYNSYVATYIERDVRQILSIGNLSSFQRFLQLCAGRVGQVINLVSIASDTGVSHNTIKSWLSVLESSYIIFQMQPYYKNYRKRLIKSPKLYFYDTGLAAWLLGIQDHKDIVRHFAYGNLFENLVVSEYVKHIYHNGLRRTDYFWRDRKGSEIDLIIDKPKLSGIEIKAGKTISQDFFTNLLSWKNVVKENVRLHVIYGGDEYQRRNEIELLPWRKMNKAWDSK